MADPGTKVVVVGMCQETDHFEPMQCVLKRLKLIFTYYFLIDEYRYTIEMMNQKRIDPNPMISHMIKLEGLSAMIETMQKPTDQIKVIVSFES